MSSATTDIPSGGILLPAGDKPWSDKQYYALRRSKTVIGRGSQCDIRINNPTVSRTHLELTWSNGELLLTPLSPINPTLVNGVPISKTCGLRTGDYIEIADGIILRLELFGCESATTLPRGRDTRRMFAIVSADVVAYSRLVETDDLSTARQLETCVAIIRRETENADGRVANITGDGVLSVFTSVVSAVNCALELQRKIGSVNEGVPPARRMEFRVGIDSGEVLITPMNDLHGDAINIAVRVQSLASPGGILVTGIVYDQLQGRNDIGFEYLGIHQLKNLSREVRIYRVNFAHTT